MYGYWVGSLGNCGVLTRELSLDQPSVHGARALRRSHSDLSPSKGTG